MTRLCSRPGCAEPANATLTYHYARSVVWIDALSAERDPHDYDLCDRHAARLSAPHRWQVDDRRPTVVDALLSRSSAATSSAASPDSWHQRLAG